MKKKLICAGITVFLFACNNETDKPAETTATEKPAAVADLPYKATYSSHFTDEVSDADLKMVLTTYKDWADGNMEALSKGMGDSVTVIFNNGEVFNNTNAELMKRWRTYRDSLSSVTIEMQAWKKMHEPEKHESAILTWYKEIDTYKDGRVDSAEYHDVNGVKNGKITYYSQYKRPLK